MPRALHKCPACGGRLMATTLYCEDCHIEIRGEFERSRLAELSVEQEEFVLKFLAVRGSLKEMERIMGVSYPTVRARLDDILYSLGLRAEGIDEIDQDEKRQAILDDLEAGRIGTQEAVELLRKLKAGD